MGKQAILEIEDCDKEIVNVGKEVGPNFDELYKEKYSVMPVPLAHYIIWVMTWNGFVPLAHFFSNPKEISS